MNKSLTIESSIVGICDRFQCILVSQKIQEITEFINEYISLDMLFLDNVKHSDNFAHSLLCTILSTNNIDLIYSVISYPHNSRGINQLTICKDPENSNFVVAKYYLSHCLAEAIL